MERRRKVLVTVKRVVDCNVKIRVKPDGSGVELNNVKMTMDPFDENSVAEALRPREAGKAAEAVVISVGPAPGSSEKFRNVILPVADKLGAAVGAQRLAGRTDRQGHRRRHQGRGSADLPDGRSVPRLARTRTINLRKK
jgi:electron transfer flavoprotein alpha subunit